MSESLIVKVRLLQDAQEAIRDRIESMLQLLGLPVTGAEELTDLLDMLEDELRRREEI